MFLIKYFAKASCGAVVHVLFSTFLSLKLGFCHIGHVFSEVSVTQRTFLFKISLALHSKVKVS